MDMTQEHKFAAAADLLFMLSTVKPSSPTIGSNFFISSSVMSSPRNAIKLQRVDGVIHMGNKHHSTRVLRVPFSRQIRYTLNQDRDAQNEATHHRGDSPYVRKLLACSGLCGTW